MFQKVMKIEINEDTSDEDLQLCILAAEKTTDINIVRKGAAAMVEQKRRRDRQERERMIAVLNAQETARVKSQKFQEAQLTRLIDAGRFDADQTKSLSESFTAAETMTLATSSSAKAGYDGVAGATDSTAEVVRDFIEKPPTNEEEYDSKLAAIQEKTGILEQQIESSGVPMTGSSKCKADFERDIKTATTKGEVWRCWMTYLNCMGSEWGKGLNISLININLGGGGEGE